MNMEFDNSVDVEVSTPETLTAPIKLYGYTFDQIRDALNFAVAHGWEAK